MWLFSGTTGPSFVIVILPSFYKTVTADCDRGCLPFSRRNRKFRLENQTVRVIPFGKVQKFWAAGWGDAYFLFFLVSSADFATLWNFSFFHEVKLNHLMFVDGFSKRMVCVNGKGRYVFSWGGGEGGRGWGILVFFSQKSVGPSLRFN